LDREFVVSSEIQDYVNGLAITGHRVGGKADRIERDSLRFSGQAKGGGDDEHDSMHGRQ